MIRARDAGTALQATGETAGESELVARARTGSVAAFTELVQTHRPRLFRFLLTRCPSHADAEDALQDALLNAFRYLSSYDPRWRFSTWLYRIAINEATRHRQAHHGLDDEPADHDADPLRAVMAASEQENLWLTARRVLADEVCTALWLRYAEDMSVRDVAAVLGRTTAWTKVNLMRARQSLEKALGGAPPGKEGHKAYGRT
jgi:RNA polymerase sigma-70 factor (ECF subfamily)